jgi:hypothetical protein
VVSDLFEIRDGRLVAKEETAAEAPGGSTAPADNALQPRDSVVTDDLIVEGSVCASDSDACADGEAFLTPLAVNAQLKLKDSSPVLWLNDTTSGHDDWVIRAETGTLRIQNADTGNDAIFIEEDAPDLSLYIEGSSAGGGIGFGTSNPTAHIHVVGGSPTIRLSEISKPEISVDLALKNPEELFVIRRSNNFESLFTIDLVTGRIGIGTGRPTAALDIAPRDGAADLRLASAGESWRFTNRGDVMTVSRDGSGAEELTIRDGLDAAGPTLVVEGSVQGTQVVNTSSRELKTSFEDLDEAAVLAKLAELPVTAWRYRHEPPGSRHIGPVAEDFQALFGLGDGETISTVDAVGVLMAAVQALHERVQELEGREPTGAAAPIGGE